MPLSPTQVRHGSEVCDIMGFVGPAAALLRKDQHVNWQFWIVLGDSHFWSSKTVISKIELNRIDD